MEQALAEAQQRYEDDPSLEHTIWYGRRAAYLFQFERAIAIFSNGLARFPAAHQLLRHRGHRYLSTRRFREAIADFEQAAQLALHQPVEVEPDGMPNQLNIPLSNSHFNIFYHLGLAHYLTGAYEQAAAAYTRCLEYANNDDSLIATTDWLYMTYRRLGDRVAAARVLEPIHERMTIVEDAAYYRRLLLYKGALSPEQLLAPAAEAGDDHDVTLATEGYGVGNWHLYNGDRATARAIFERVVQTQSWTAFGYIAAEVDLVSLRAHSQGT
jgi:tetratricopeptide (TPR) repeat protein